MVVVVLVVLLAPCERVGHEAEASLGQVTCTLKCQLTAALAAACFCCCRTTTLTHKIFHRPVCCAECLHSHVPHATTLTPQAPASGRVQGAQGASPPPPPAPPPSRAPPPPPQQHKRQEPAAAQRAEVLLAVALAAPLHQQWPQQPQQHGGWWPRCQQLQPEQQEQPQRCQQQLRCNAAPTPCHP